MTSETVKKYYGFAKKAGSIAIGTDKIAISTNIHLILASSTLAQNAIKRLERKANKSECQLVLFSEEDFRQFEPNENIRAVGIKSAEIAKAMQK